MGRYDDASGKVAGRIGKEPPPAPADPQAPKANPHACCANGCAHPARPVLCTTG